MRRRILFLTLSEFTRDPRARPAAQQAQEWGFEAVALSGQGGLTEAGPALPGVDVYRVKSEGVAQRLRRSPLAPARGRTIPLVRELHGLFRLARLVWLTIGLVRVGLKLGRFTVVHACTLEPLPAAWLIARRSGASLVYEQPELYTEQEEDPPLLHRLVMGWIEGFFGRRADAVIAITEPIAHEMERRMRLRTTPLVRLNCPARVDHLEPREPSRDGLLRAVYQASMGRSRPLADLLDAAELAPELLLTIRVVGADYDALRDEVAARGLGERVVIASPVAQTELITALLDYEVGLIINRPVTMTDKLTLPNKLFEYFMAGLAVVAPGLPAMGALVAEESVGRTFEPGSPASMAAALRELARDPAELEEMRRRARAVALARYNASVQADVLAAAWNLDRDGVA